MIKYFEKLKEYNSKYQNYSFDEFEKEKKINEYDYNAMGYGYMLKDEKPNNEKEARDYLNTPYLDELEKLANDI